MNGALILRDLVKIYGPTRAVDGINLDVAAGEFVTLLGPSGSGKTTTLQMITGFVAPDGGTVTLDGRDLTDMPAWRRNIGMVFQNYALFPHMTVEQNLAFPLEARGVDRAESRRRIAGALELVGLSGFEERLPRQLSGGQQQRVAVARAIVYRPPLLLMDEPLGALDKKLRDHLQIEIMELCRLLGVTVVYVTHDQEEALIMSSRIAIFNRGRIEQIGTPAELYEHPSTVFVADFIGESNMITGTLESIGGECAVRLGDCVVRVAQGRCRPGEAVSVVVRPERLRLGAASGNAAIVLEGHIHQAVYLGPMRKYVVDTAAGVRFTARIHSGSIDGALEPGDAVQVSWDMADGVVLPEK